MGAFNYDWVHDWKVPVQEEFYRYDNPFIYRPGTITLSLPKQGLLAYCRPVDTIGESGITPFVYIPTFTGTETLTLAHLTGTETVVTKTGTANNPVINAGSISLGVGTLGYLLLSDGTELVFEGALGVEQSTAYNVDGTGRHATLIGANAAPFDTASSDVSYLAIYGGKHDSTDNVELFSNFDFAAWTNDNPDSFPIICGSTYNDPIEDANNYITQTPSGLRIVSDGELNYVGIQRGISTAGKYRVTIRVESITGVMRVTNIGEEKLIHYTGDYVFDIETTAYAGMRLLNTFSNPLDVTLSIVSCQKLVPGIIPALKTGAVDAIGGDLSFTTPWGTGYPGFIRIASTPELIAADNLLQERFLFDGVGNPLDITSDKWKEFTGGSLENVFFRTETTLVFYSSRLSKRLANSAFGYLGLPRKISMAIFGDGHFVISSPYRWNWLIEHCQQRDVDSIISCGDNYGGDADPLWSTTQGMIDTVAVLEDKFTFLPENKKSFALGNHSKPPSGTLDDFLAVSTLVQENSVRVWRDIAVININTVEPVGYNMPADSLTFLETELENARLRGNRVILNTHIEAYPTGFQNHEEAEAIIATAQANGVEIIAWWSGHFHAYYDGVHPALNIPYHACDNLSQITEFYIMHVDSSGYTVETINDGI